MARIILITGTFRAKDSDGYQTGRKEFVVDHAFNEDTDEPVIVPCEHPRNLGGIFDPQLGEWVIPERSLTLKATA